MNNSFLYDKSPNEFLYEWKLLLKFISWYQGHNSSDILYKDRKLYNIFLLGLGLI